HAPTITLTTNIADVHGVGEKRANAFRKLGIRCVADLLLHLPMRYEHELPEQSIDVVNRIVDPEHGSDKNLAVQGEVLNTRLRGAGRRGRFEATLHDGTGTILLTWFNAPWMRDKLHPGANIRAWGKTKRWGDYLQMTNPKWELIGEESTGEGREERYRPIYPASEELSSRQIELALEAVLEPALEKLEDHLHEAYRAQAALPELREAYRMVHRPEDEDDIQAGRRRLAFDEFFLLQLGVMLKRQHRRETLRAPALKHDEAIDEHIRARFPFRLTAAQNAVIDDLVHDLTRTEPMNRLVQGDVGAGKTVVALYAMLTAVASGHQAALMAPTALLAEQHLSSITQMLEGSRVRIALLTAATKGAARKELLADLAEGRIDLLIGTHALLTEHVSFRSLGVAVIDEQHRFGVHQRATIRAKSADRNSAPHILVMTATPIPRTLSLTVFGDLDTSSIRGMPPGRQPIVTRHVLPDKAPDVYRYVAQRIAQGEQAYIVVPVIEESASGLKDVESHYHQLAQGPLAGARLAILHGRIKRDDREAIMERFRAGEIDALIATTVIEVGVDVPNATMMIIEHAERFGLAQLHQLRGRVGRGTKKSLCVLIADPTTEDGIARINALISTTDGFAIAEKDLEIRGPGELFGSRQAGLAPFRVADLPRDLELLRMARRDAERWVKENPRLTGERDALLKKRLLKAYGKTLGLGDVA
ncbi:MAG: ATP-dependent DNA helicase RecG, partial [Phycisphaerales bacterium]